MNSNLKYRLILLIAFRKGKRKVIREMSIDEIVDLLQVLPENKVEKILEKLSIDELKM